MKKEHLEILDLLKDYLENHPDQRFGQALFNLRINEFKKSSDPLNPIYELRDIHGDNDKDIVERIKAQLEWFDLQRQVNEGKSKVTDIGGMTVNERLYATGLIDTFDKMKTSNKDYARYILESLHVDNASIDKILN